MWGGPGTDPGGTKGGDTSTGPPSNQELMDLKDQFEQQQVLIAQLKEMLRKTEQTTVTEEKVEEYANTLTRIRAKKGKMKREGDGSTKTEIVTTIDTPAKEKIMLLRQQMEENKLKLAERGKFQKGIEETVTQLKAQLDDSQQLISQTTLNLSISEPKTEQYSVNSTSEELFNLALMKDKRIAELNSKVQKLEANVIDLQENLKEKDSVIDARTKAITLMTESLSKKGKHTLDTLDDTKEQMRKMQENFINLEMQMKSERDQLLIELQEKNSEIERLQTVNVDLEKTCSEQREELEAYKNDTISAKEENLNKQIEELNNRIVELEAQSVKPADVQRDSPQRSSKKGKKGQKMQKSKSKETKDDPETTIADLQKQLEDNKVECERQLNKLSEYETTISELTLTVEELKVTQTSAKPEVTAPASTTADSVDVAKLKKQLDDSNKNMIKLKAQHKSKLKELSKTIDELKKGSGNAELVRLQTENSKLNEKIEFLEKQKSDETDGANLDKERLKELEIQLIEQSEILESKTQSIATLEEQIDSYKTEIKSLNERFQKLSNLENDQVVSEITSIHFEEQLDKLEMEKNNLKQEMEDVLHEKEELLERVEVLIKEKQEINIKLESYVQENMELIDKLEKLSAEKVSSAESIEIVEGLTQQEKLELEAYQKSLETENIKNSDENLEQNPELNESVNQLTEETSDLLRKIELFTEERREVMEKMEALTNENNQLNLKIQEIENNRDVLAETYEQLQNEKEDLDCHLEQQKKKVTELEARISELDSANKKLQENLDDPHEIKHGSEVEETIKLERVVPLTATASESNADLQKQIDEYKALVDIQKQEIQELRLQLLSQKDLTEANKNLHEKITSLQAQYETLLSENEQLNKNIKENSERVHEKDSIETELGAAKKRINEFEMKLTDNLAEMENYKSIVEENKNELISSSNLINDLQNKLQQKQNEIVHYESEITHLNSVIAELNSAVSHLENENRQNNSNNETMELMSDQLQELKVILNENIKQIEHYEKEVQESTNTISILNTQLKELNDKLLDMEHELECKDDEITKLIKERDNKELMINSLQSELKEKDEKFHKVCDTLKEKCLNLQSQVEQNTGSIDKIKDPLSKIEALERKNKEQLEKMKKIAANLKKKTTAYQELEVKYKQDTEKWETERNEKTQLVQIQENKIQSLLEQLHDLEKEFSVVQSQVTVNVKEVSNLSNELEKLRQENEDLQNAKQNYEMTIQRLTSQVSTENNTVNVEINEKNEIIRSLRQQLETIQYESKTNSNALHAKIQELESFIESQEAELTKYKEKVNKLEEGLRTVEERRLSLEQKTIELGSQLQEKSNSYEEISQTEDILEQRLAALMVHDDKIEKRLREATMENNELADRNRILTDENDELKHKLSSATEKSIDISFNLEKLGDLENESEELHKTVAHLENENRQLRSEHEKKLNEQKLEVEAMEVELQGQLDQMDNERKTLMIQCEQLKDQLQEQIEAYTLVQSDLDEHKKKLQQQQSDLNECAVKYEQISSENRNNLSTIEQLNFQLNSANLNDSHQTVQELRQVILEKNAEIEHYQKQNLQLQMQGAFGHAQDNMHNELQTVQNDLKVTRDQLAKYENENSELQIINSNLKKKIEQLEKHASSGHLQSPQVQSADPQSVVTFTWPEPSTGDPFDFVTISTPPTVDPGLQATSQLSLQSPPSVPVEAPTHQPNLNEELLQKIKTLEFMLFNTEKEKEDVLGQCQELTAEVARLIYEKQLEKQICSEDDSVLTREECKKLKSVEFAKVQEHKPFQEGQPVQEETITESSAYLCYKSDAPPDVPNLQKSLQDTQQPPNLEEQVVLVQDTEITKKDLQQLHGLEFGQTKPCKDVADSKRTQPVSEDVIQPETAYLCYPKSPQASPQHRTQTSTLPEASGLSLDAFDENDDGWGCGMEEVRLEEAHQQTRAVTTSSSRNLNNQHIMEELDERIRALELERERHVEEIKQVQVKSGKLIKKLKEFKALNEKLTSDLRKSKSNNFGGLDDAITDELQSQISKLEKKIKETASDLEKEKTEKSNLVKKADVLQSANERMVEMKEKQDIEMLMLQRHARELSAKLEQFEWGDDGFDSPKHSKPASTDTAGNANVQGLEKRIQELNDTIKDLTLDNEELQAMLEEQRNMRIAAEKAKSVEPVAENMKTEAEYLSVVTEKNDLSQQLALNVQEKKALQEQLNNLIKTNEALQQKHAALTEEKSHLQADVSRNDLASQELTLELRNLKSKYEYELQEATITISNLQQENAQLNGRLQSLETTTQQLHLDNSNLAEFQEKLSQLDAERMKLNEALHEKDVQIENLNKSITEHRNKRLEIEEQLDQSEKLADDKLKVKDSEISELLSRIEEERAELAEEWNQRVDQRGADVAESWKLHLESRETEFSQMEQQLRKEINEFDEKCNALVNENNELRKNVDAEIRNEVDKISALQQQINERQHYINDLTKVLQEKQAEIEQQHQKLTEFESITVLLQSQIKDRDDKIAEIEKKMSSLIVEVEEKDKLIDELKHKLQELVQLQHQLDNDQLTVVNLRQEVDEKQKLIEEYLRQSQQYQETCTNLEQRLNEKECSFNEINQKLQNVQKENENNGLLQQEISNFNVQLEDRQTQITKLSKELENYKNLNEHLGSKDAEIEQYKTEINYLNSLLTEKESLGVQLQQKQTEVESLYLQLQNYQQFTQDAEFKDVEINQLKSEVNNLKSLLDEKEREYNHNLHTANQDSEMVFHEKAHELDTLKRRQIETESHYEELLTAKEVDMENLRIQLQEQLTRNEALMNDCTAQEGTVNDFKEQLDVKTQECEELQQKIYEHEALHREESKQLTELRQIIEDQVLKIEGLKQELFDKSKDYDSLIAELDIRKPSRSEPGTPPLQQHQDESLIQTEKSEATPSRSQNSEDDYLEPVSRAELDLALYMLHQRDVRCEELTVELMQLLEERDTLQLKLSNAIREKEELRGRFLPRSDTPDSADAEATNLSGVTPTSTPTGKASAIVLGATGTELATEATEQLQGDPLAHKLSELKTIGYRKDKTLLDEQEQRRLQQLSLMQQHRDVAALLPPEAAARLVHEASYTLSRDVQSPSKVLLNWLWGRSTPKVNNV